MVQVLAIGEVMVELAPVGEAAGKRLMALGYAGDTFNTAIYLSRLGTHVGYFTRLGDDPYSVEVQKMMQEEGVNIEGVETVAGRTPGLYLIANQPNGERSFCFWRSQSPAREMFATDISTQSLVAQLAKAKAVYLSGISLGILNDETRACFLNLLQDFRKQGGKVIFDNNYRPQLWRDRDQAQQSMNAALKVTDIALLTDDDASRLWGSLEADHIIQHCLDAKVEEVVVKRGPNPVIIAQGWSEGGYRHRTQVNVPPVADVVDTTAAGDSFNAGYLHARFKNLSLEIAAQIGSRCASVVIRHRGAIVDRSVFLESVQSTDI